MSDNRQQPATRGDIQTVGHLVASFTGALVIALVQFGVPLTPQQQSAILSIVVTGWALFAGVYAWTSRVGHPAPKPPPPSPPTVVGVVGTTDINSRTAQLRIVGPPTGETQVIPRVDGASHRPPPTWPPYNPGRIVQPPQAWGDPWPGPEGRHNTV